MSAPPAVRELELPGVLEITPQRHEDERGFFSETWNSAALASAGFTETFVQDVHAQSRRKGVLRGLHYQLRPHAQGKLVRVLRGAIFDVAVDVRRASATFGRWVSLVVSRERWNQIFIPVGFAHGYLTLEDDTEVAYKVTAPYAPADERGIRFDDPALGIDWPIPAGEMQLSAKDRAAPLLAAAEALP